MASDPVIARIDARVPQGGYHRCTECGSAVFRADVMLAADGPGVGIVAGELTCTSCGATTVRDDLRR